MDRCSWCLGEEGYIRYHDEEWGVPVHDDRKQFEFLVLEGAQAGLSWLTILRKRAGYRRAYCGFDPEVVAGYDEAKVQELLADPGIVRNGAKIRSSVNNARRFLEVQKEFGSFDRYLWRFVNDQPVVNRWRTLSEIPASTPLAETVSKELKKRGFSFVGPVVMYSHLQAVGIVNDHLIGCFRHAELAGTTEPARPA
ncbi:MAG TPA: DNA-3-methyladenine glycosylase I [Chloroflexota bacterium]